MKAELSGLNYPGISAFCFPVFCARFHLPFALCLLKRNRADLFSQSCYDKVRRANFIYKRYIYDNSIRRYLQKWVAHDGEKS